jgi:hypothetical protein
MECAAALKILQKTDNNLRLSTTLAKSTTGTTYRGTDQSGTDLISAASVAIRKLLEATPTCVIKN